MARPEAEPKTPLATRLRTFRKLIGDPDREVVAARLGVSKSALASYERGETEPTASALAAYAAVYGANLNWLITGEGIEVAAPVGEQSKLPFVEKNARDVSPSLYQEIFIAVELVYKQLGLTARSYNIAYVAAEMLNLIQARVVSMDDKRMVEAAITVLCEELAENLRSTAPQHGTGK